MKGGIEVVEGCIIILHKVYQNINITIKKYVDKTY